MWKTIGMRCTRELHFTTFQVFTKRAQPHTNTQVLVQVDCFNACREPSSHKGVVWSALQWCSLAKLSSRMRVPLVLHSAAEWLYWSIFPFTEKKILNFAWVSSQRPIYNQFSVHFCHVSAHLCHFMPVERTTDSSLNSTSWAALAVGRH